MSLYCILNSECTWYKVPDHEQYTLTCSAPNGAILLLTVPTPKPTMVTEMYTAALHGALLVASPSPTTAREQTRMTKYLYKTKKISTFIRCQISLKYNSNYPFETVLQSVMNNYYNYEQVSQSMNSRSPPFGWDTALRSI